MPVGRRPNQLFKDDLVAKLREAEKAQQYSPLSQLGLLDLIAACDHHNLLTEDQLRASLPRDNNTVKCYLYTLLEDGESRELVDAYVQAWSLLCVRGSKLVNMLAMHRLGNERLPDAPVQRFLPGAPIPDRVSAFWTVLQDVNVVKQFFLPERWPSSLAPRHALVHQALQLFGPQLACFFPDNWRDLMLPTGWDNAINRMGDQFLVNLGIHVRCHLKTRIRKYLEEVWIHCYRPGTRSEVKAHRLISSIATYGGVRPLCLNQEDFELALFFRRILGAEDRPDAWIPKYPSEVTPDVWRLHVFLVQQGVGSTYLPVSAVTRHYAYVDAKITPFLLKQASRTQEYKHILRSHIKDVAVFKKLRRFPLMGPFTREQQEAVDAFVESNPAPEPPDLSACDGILGITRDKYRAARKAARKQLRARARKVGRGKRSRRRGNGFGGWSQDASVTSILTDGVGLSIHLDTPVAYDGPAQYAKLVLKLVALRQGQKKKRSADAQLSASPDPKHLWRERHPDPVFGAEDRGRAKISTLAFTTGAPGAKPKTLVFTRHQYYYEIRHKQRMQWEADNTRSSGLDPILAQLSASGGIRNASMQRWQAYLAVYNQHSTTLLGEYVARKDRALWRMRLYRWKRSSQDNAANRIVRCGERTKPLVLGTGDAKFAATGRGERAVPTTEFDRSLQRAVWAARRPELRKAGADGVQRRVATRGVFWMTVTEHKTTVTCCNPECRMVSQPVQFWRWDGQTCSPTPYDSRRLRVCTHCCKERDRDVQAARNILCITMDVFNDRPVPDAFVRT